VQITVASASPGFTVKTRQHPVEARVAMRTNVAPAGAVVDPGDGSESLPIGAEVHA
jgi:hypothetical protein